MDLYETLGVPREASDAAIRRAYRHKAKTAHPDGGGSVERFTHLRIAYDTLTDDERRSRYDRTGEYEETKVDSTVSDGMQLAVRAVENILAAMERADVPAWRTNVIDEACDSLRFQVGEIEKGNAKLTRDIAKTERVGKRFKAKDGKEPFLADMMKAKADSMRNTIRTNQGLKDRMEVALNLLKDHEYDMTPDPGVVDSSDFLARFLT